MKRSYSFIYNGKFLECDSIIELKTGLDDLQWEAMVGETIDSYMQLFALDKSKSVPMDNQDLRMMRMLRRTIEFVKNIDFAAYNKFHTDERLKSYAQLINDEVQRLELAKTELPNTTKPVDPNNIIVSSL